jgi:hypothetical protein
MVFLPVPLLRDPLVADAPEVDIVMAPKPGDREHDRHDGEADAESHPPCIHGRPRFGPAQEPPAVGPRAITRVR